MLALSLEEGQLLNAEDGAVSANMQHEKAQVPENNETLESRDEHGELEQAEEEQEDLSRSHESEGQKIPKESVERSNAANTNLSKQSNNTSQGNHCAAPVDTLRTEPFKTKQSQANTSSIVSGSTDSRQRFYGKCTLYHLPSYLVPIVTLE